MQARQLKALGGFAGVPNVASENVRACQRHGVKTEIGEEVQWSFKS
jgi:hypothetical protein